MSNGFGLFSIISFLLALGASANSFAAESAEVYFQNGKKSFVSIDADRAFCRMSTESYRRHQAAPSRVVNLYYYEPLTGNFGGGEIHETRVHTEDGADIECISDHKPDLAEIALLAGGDLTIDPSSRPTPVYQKSFPEPTRVLMQLNRSPSQIGETRSSTLTFQRPADSHPNIIDIELNPVQNPATTSAQ